MPIVLFLLRSQKPAIKQVQNYKQQTNTKKNWQKIPGYALKDLLTPDISANPK